MRLLLVAEDVPNRSVTSGDGSSMISYELLRHLPDDVVVDLLTFRREVPLPRDVLERCRHVELLPLLPPRRAVLLSLATGRHPGSVARRTRHSRRRIRELSGAADVTLLHGPHVLELAHDVSGPAVAQVVDPWSQRSAMDAALSRGALSAYRRVRARRALRLERAVPPDVRLLTVAAADAAGWSRRLGRDVLAVPNGADVVTTAAARPPQPTACFVGSLDYGPNVDSVQRLVRQVLPLARRTVPGLQVVIAGRRPTAEVTALAGPHVTVRADVPSMQQVLLGAHVAVFPDRFGVGVRNSVRDALTAGLPVVATRVAARGIEPSPRLLLADDDAGLAAAVIQALHEPALAPTAPVVPARTWADAATDYVRLLRAAAASRAA